ncbi:hypothetical protein AMK59_3178 [Oryctes borbonicus]|uniref:Uncharacterized protein n=1 Tax=Oryctes borbonicus TaxID=1629725 RepID=A0A0T6B524_9SCAR|nr:hypothetical protein AMK59_3178 [Oryctes borbonicus]
MLVLTSCTPFRNFFDSLHKMIKPNGQIFTTLFNDTFLRRSFYRQFKEGKCAQYVKPALIVANYTDKSDQYLSELLTDTGFQVELCHAASKSYQTENFRGNHVNDF